MRSKNNKKELNMEATQTTEFSENNRVMTHDFGSGFKIITNFDTETACKMNGNELVDKFSIKDMDFWYYSRIVSNFAKAVKH